MKSTPRAHNAPAGSYMSHADITAQRAHQLAIEARIERERKQRYLSSWQRTTSNVGVHTRPESYTGPKQFEVYHPLTVAQLHAGESFKGRPPVPFIIRWDDHLIRPFGGFRVYWRDIEVGRTLSWPEYETCRRLRETRRYSADARERKLLSTD